VSLTFIVGTGRCGSTALSRVFREHPDVLSVSEIFFRMKRTLISKFPDVDGREMWRMFSEPLPFVDDIIRAGIKFDEMCYPYGKGRFHPASGVPMICHNTLPILTDDPDALFYTRAAEMVTWPKRPAADHFRALFGFLCDLFGKSAVVERTGASVELVPLLRGQFPEARFVHLYRDGPVCALSMSRHPIFRLRGFRAEVTRLIGEDPRSQAEIMEQFRGLVMPPLDAERFTSYPILLTFFGELWSELLCRGVPALAELPPGTWTSLAYENLITSPAAELSRLAAFIGVPATP
jgi:hypothetical protein